jgi:hypothetical protein
MKKLQRFKSVQVCYYFAPFIVTFFVFSWFG